MDPATIWKTTDTDLAAVREIIEAAYSKYLSRMDLLPVPMLRDVSAETLWVAGDPVTGLISLTPKDSTSFP